MNRQADRDYLIRHRRSLLALGLVQLAALVAVIGSDFVLCRSHPRYTSGMTGRSVEQHIAQQLFQPRAQCVRVANRMVALVGADARDLAFACCQWREMVRFRERKQRDRVIQVQSVPAATGARRCSWDSVPFTRRARSI